MQALYALSLLIILFLVSRPEKYTEPPPVPENIVELLINGVQRGDADLVPLETLFIDDIGQGLHRARFMFFNTRTFTGAQYDVEARVSQVGNVVITKMTQAARPDYNWGFKPDTYQSFEVIDSSVASALAKYQEKKE